ncbi:hypothetical protein CEXT_442621 [Caerostris extrusa]|uniref:Uncharacterized protein n=1 Tax=Caerostris extrusa TaxID=172846 RepID=A0AAV4PEG6_CAEEX|nr:hypothetical protein CEXT_442621 [Caerostris extrusa]
MFHLDVTPAPRRFVLNQGVLQEGHCRLQEMGGIESVVPPVVPNQVLPPLITVNSPAISAFVSQCKIFPRAAKWCLFWKSFGCDDDYDIKWFQGCKSCYTRE